MERPNSKIFIQIASYRDPQLISTIEDCIDKAKHPDNLNFCIAWQRDQTESLDKYKNDPRFTIISIPFERSKGACWARHQIQQNYNGEQYTLQLDSHHRFVQDWDEQLISMIKQLQSDGYEKPLLTGYIPSYDPTNDPTGRVQVPWQMNFDRFIPEGAVFFLPAEIKNWRNLTKPIPARFYSAHFCFTLGQFCEEVPHDPEYYFHGEEISIAVRAYTWGYDLFHPHKVIAWHEYTRKGRTKQWDDDKTWTQRNSHSHLRNRKLFEMDGEKRDVHFGKYGFGNVRSLKDYEKYAGISFSKRAIQKYTQEHHLPPNPTCSSEEEFDKSLLKIFKHCIDIPFDKLTEKDYDFWVVAFHGKKDNTLCRRDANKEEIKNLLKDSDGYCKIWREFTTDETPSYWVVWPHSETKGWTERITGTL